ncbi:hypothetical protein [Sphingomonas sp.]|uniref:hypothetical protein n=1 Tax=Sphingomonas sp. TaxID=28214 RepID=UPI00307D51F3
MSVNGPEREVARAELSALVAALNLRLATGAVAGDEMIRACRHVLDLWIDGGGASLDDEVIAFLGIESQSDHVLREGSWGRANGRDGDGTRFEPGSEAERQEVEEIGRFFSENFADAIGQLAAHLGIASPPSQRA